MAQRLVPLLFLLLAACGSPAPRPTPTPSPTSTAADVCHQNGVTYCAVNPAVTQDTIGKTICVRGWTKTIPPPVTFTDNLKRQQMQQEGLTGLPSAYEEDHRPPLELGGAARDVTNLRPEPGARPKPSARDEDAFRQLVCSHQVGRVAAQVQFIARWLAPYPGYQQ